MLLITLAWKAGPYGSGSLESTAMTAWEVDEDLDSQAWQDVDAYVLGMYRNGFEIQGELFDDDLSVTRMGWEMPEPRGVIKEDVFDGQAELAEHFGSDDPEFNADEWDGWDGDVPGYL